MSADLVSVVIPTYNYGRFVPEAVESVLGQTYPAREVIVVDDGSTDDTRARLATYLPHIRYVYQDNRGLSAARNTGIALAGGRFVALLDSDDVWHPRKLEYQMRHLARHPEVALLGSDCYTGPRAAWPEPPDDAAVAPVALDRLIVRSAFAPSTAVLRRDCLEAVGGFDTGLRAVEDRDMWIRVAARYPVAVLRAPLCWYRVHGGNMSAAAARMEECELRVLRKSFGTIDALRGRPLLRRRALSWALAASAWTYREGGDPGAALARLLRSLALWPLPYRRGEATVPLVRARLLASLALRALAPRPNRPAPAAG